MLSLRDAQAAFATTVREGPDQYPDGMFTGTRDRALLGLKVHANTVSHARLVALEETFPLTRAAMGEGVFNAASRKWLDTGHGCDCPLALIGERFPDWLANPSRHPELVSGSTVEPGSFNEGDAQPWMLKQVQHDGAGDQARHTCAAFARLARFEWLWLESYHAAEATPVSPDAFQATAPEALLALTISQHQATRLTGCDARIADVLGLSETPPHILIARPEADVLVHPLTAPLARLFSLFDGTANLGAVLETFWAEWPNEDAVVGINHLISIGVLTMENASC